MSTWHRCGILVPSRLATFPDGLVVSGGYQFAVEGEYDAVCHFKDHPGNASKVIERIGRAAWPN
jgi:hypothetical protein